MSNQRVVRAVDRELLARWPEGTRRAYRELVELIGQENTDTICDGGDFLFYTSDSSSAYLSLAGITISHFPQTQAYCLHANEDEDVPIFDELSILYLWARHNVDLLYRQANKRDMGTHKQLGEMRKAHLAGHERSDLPAGGNWIADFIDPGVVPRRLGGNVRYTGAFPMLAASLFIQ